MLFNLMLKFVNHKSKDVLLLTALSVAQLTSQSHQLSQQTLMITKNLSLSFLNKMFTSNKKDKNVSDTFFGCS